MISKKITLVTSLIIIILLFILDSLGTDKLCGGKQYTGCMQSLHSTFIIFLPIIALFVFSLVTFRMREEVYQAWFRFARWWIPLSMLAILIAPEYSRDFLYPIEKGSVAFLTSIAFLIISALIVTIKFFTSKRA